MDRMDKTVVFCAVYYYISVARCKDTLVQPIGGELFQKAGIEGTWTYNTTVLTRCQEGYKLVGGDLVRCNETGQWEGSFGTCIVVRCPDLFIEENRGIILYRSGIEGNSTYNTMVSIRCLIGYNLTRRDPVVCNKYGQWNGTLGNCSAVRCADLNIQPINGVVLYQSGIDGNLTYNTTVSIRCQGGYYLTGRDLVRCNEYGQWEGTLGNCFVLRCKDTLVQPIHGELFIKAGIEGTWTYNTTVLTRCQEGYKLMGEDLVRCNETGEWGGSFGACIASQQMTMAPDDNKQIVLLLSIFVPLCFILIVTNIVTCLRLHGCACFSNPASEIIPADITIASNYGPGYEMEGLKGNNDNVHLDGDKTYDELQAQERGKSLYDHLKYAKGSYGDTSKGNRVYENISVSNSQ